MLKEFVTGISNKNRKKKYNRFLKELHPDKNTKILDVGFTEDDSYEGVNFLEKNYPYKKNITALGIEDPSNFEKKFPDVKVVLYDGGIFPFADKQFDIVWSNAVIEHVGSRQNQLTFLQEILRTGNNAFITTPNRWFPIEVHTRLPLLHYFPKPFFDKLIKKIGKGWAADDYMNLLSIADVERMLAQLNITNYKIIKNKKFLFVMDFIVIVKQPGQHV